MVLDSAALLRHLGEQGCTYMDTVPSVWEFHCQAAEPLPPSLRLAVVGGEKLELSFAQRLLQKMPVGAQLYNAYGPAECTVEAAPRALFPLVPALAVASRHLAWLWGPPGSGAGGLKPSPK